MNEALKDVVNKTAKLRGIKIPEHEKLDNSKGFDDMKKISPIIESEEIYTLKLSNLKLQEENAHLKKLLVSIKNECSETKEITGDTYD